MVARVGKHFRAPLAKIAIVTDANNTMCVCSAHKAKTVYWVVMAFLC